MSSTATSTMQYELQELPEGNSRVELSNNAGPPSSSPKPENIGADSREEASRSNLHKFLVVFQLCSINFMASFASGAITVGLPTMAKSLSFPKALYTWPSSVYGLSSGATILLAGDIANVVGARPIELLGAFILSTFTLACGFAQTPIQLVIFRALQGTGMSMHLPTSVALVAESVPQGKGRNLSFGCLGLSQPLGFSAGLVISGIMIERVGWRSSFYLAGAACLAAAVSGIWILPKPSSLDPDIGISTKLRKLWSQVDWIGCILASAGLALLTYVLSAVSADLPSIKNPVNGVLLAMSCIALISFPFWMRHRERSNKAPLIPNSLWKKKAFTSICAMVALGYGAANSIELYSSLYFQNIQHTSTLFTSLRLLPNLLVGVVISLSVGLLVHRVPVQLFVAGSSVLCSISPLLMAVVDPNVSYWYVKLWAQVLGPFSADVLFTVGLLVVSQEFPEDKQNLAGAVFNTVAQFGWSLGVGLCQVVAFIVSDTESKHRSKGSGQDVQSLLDGYRASFWTIFSFLVTSIFLAVGGLRTIGKVGVKRD